MRLISATVRNYRIHREVAAEFDPQRTLIGGPNECGKSTLAEAIHRALFFPARSTAEPQRRMRSNIHAGQPEVELVFEARGNRYRLTKRFSGQSGTTTLAREGGKTTHGSEAESALAEILGVPDNLGAKATTAQWSHLWIEQGHSGDNPCADANAQRDALVSRLQNTGGAAAMQSDLDARVAALFAQKNEALFTKSGAFKTGTIPQQAEQAVERARSARDAAANRLAELHQAAVDFESAVEAIDQSAKALAELQKEQSTLDERRLRIDQLQRKLAEEERAAGEARQAWDDFSKANQGILDLAAEIRRTEAEIAPDEEKTARLVEAREQSQQAVKEAETALERASAALRYAQIASDFATACRTLLEKTEECSNVSSRVKQGQAWVNELAGLQKKLAELPKVESGELKDLQKISTALTRSRAALEAMATGVEVLSADESVLIGGAPKEAGQSEVLTDVTEIEVGGVARLLIRPGGGTTLEDAKATAADLERRLDKRLRDLGVKSLDEAAEVKARRDEVTRQIAALEQRLEDLGLSEQKKRLDQLSTACVEIQAQIDRLRRDNPSLPAIPGDLKDAVALVRATSEQLNTAKTEEDQARKGRDAAARKLDKTITEYNAQAGRLDKARSKLNESRTRLKILVETHGGDEARKNRLAELERIRNETAAVVERSRQSLEELQPGRLEGSLARVKRALEEKAGAQRAAEDKRLTAQTVLRRDGTQDPEADLAQAEADLRSAEDRLASARQHAEAIRLLHDLFKEEQRILAEHFTQPLADKITGYLQCVFGARAQSHVVLDNGEFQGIELTRPDLEVGSISFADLSGGTREQLAAATRLAMAEVLAESHDGCLPIVFDDSFAYSDPQRVKTLQDMLDLAARRGLQVIILSCNPADYAGLGAREVILSLAPSHGRRQNGIATPHPPREPDQRPRDKSPTEVHSDIEDFDALEAIFLNTLNSTGGTLGNQSLRLALGLNQQTYDRIKNRLLASGQIVRGKGKGGSVSLIFAQQHNKKSY